MGKKYSNPEPPQGVVRPEPPPMPPLPPTTEQTWWGHALSDGAFRRAVETIVEDKIDEMIRTGRTRGYEHTHMRGASRR